MKRTRIQTQLAEQKRIAGDALESQLRNLAERVAQARETLAANKQLDPHLIVNASAISEYIARWNLVLHLIPYAETP